MIELKHYQQEAIDKVRQVFASGKKRVLIQMATGAGKTFTAAFIMKTAASKGNNTMFICNRRELIDQTALAFEKIGVHVGIIAAGYKSDWSNQVQVASIDTLRARWDDTLYYPDLVIWDECRAIASPSWAGIYEHYKDCYHIGLDATPKRLDRKPLRPFFDEMISVITIADLISEGSLVPPIVYAPEKRPDMSGVKITGGDYDAKAVAQIMASAPITGDIIDHYRRLGDGLQGLVFCPTIEYSEMIAAKFCEAGYMAVHLDGNTQKKTRKSIVERYKAGEIKLLTNVNLFTAGFDVPNVSYIADASPTKSLANFMQRAGRGARPASDKTHYILADHAGNSFAHGLPHIDRGWSLDAPPKRSKNAVSEAPVKQCDICYAVSPARSRQCSACGSDFPVEKHEPKTAAGNLVIQEALPKLSWSEVQKAVQESTGMADLYALAKRQGYKAGWCWHQKKQVEHLWQQKKVQF